MSTNYDGVIFRIKQEVVYLEKEIAENKEAGKPAFLALLHFPGMASQKEESSFSKDAYSDMRKVCDDIEKSFTVGKAHARFFDLDLISILFTECPEEKAFTFLNEYKCEGAKKAYVGVVTYENIGPALYASVYEAFGEKNVFGGNVTVSTNLSFQQNYLVDVVSRDRNEERGDLLIEAVDQAIQKYHMVVSL